MQIQNAKDVNGYALIETILRVKQFEFYSGIKVGIIVNPKEVIDPEISAKKLHVIMPII